MSHRIQVGLCVHKSTPGDECKTQLQQTSGGMRELGRVIPVADAVDQIVTAGKKIKLEDDASKRKKGTYMIYILCCAV